MGKLTTWCEQSRMRFGQEKSQLVVFSMRQRPDTSLYSSLRLCDFTVAVAQDYLYLGVTLDHKLSWTKAQRRAVQYARQQAATVTRVAMTASTVSFAPVRTLVLSLVVPSFTHGILFWGRSIDLAASTITSLQAQIATPLRVALQLPRTSHQLGTLQLCNAPTIPALAVKAQLSHLARLAPHCGVPQRGVLAPNHPTRRLHDLCIARYTKADKLQLPHNALTPAAALPLSIYLSACVLPHLLLDPELGQRLPPASLASLPQQPCPTYHSGVKYWDHMSDKRRTWAKANYPVAHMQSTIAWSIAALPHLRMARYTISSLATLVGHAQWVGQHATVVAAAPAPVLQLRFPLLGPSPPTLRPPRSHDACPVRDSRRSLPDNPPTPTSSRCDALVCCLAGHAPAPCSCASRKRRSPRPSTLSAPAAPHRRTLCSRPSPTCCWTASATSPPAPSSSSRSPLPAYTSSRRCSSPLSSSPPAHLHR